MTPSKKKYFVFDPDEYESFTSFKEALKCAKNDVGVSGWVPCRSLVVCKAVAKVVERRSTKVVTKIYET